MTDGAELQNSTCKDGPKFDMSVYNSFARNITSMKHRARAFVSMERHKPFFLLVGFGDTHRCGYRSAIGSFCEFWGSNGSIPDWKPRHYNLQEVVVPAFLPDTPAVRQDLAGMVFIPLWPVETR